MSDDGKPIPRLAAQPGIAADDVDIPQRRELSQRLNHRLLNPFCRNGGIVSACGEILTIQAENDIAVGCLMSTASKSLAICSGPFPSRQRW